jgi:hypothetical protein
MFTNRITDFVGHEPAVSPAAPIPAASAFVFLPVMLAPAAWAQRLYEEAYARARAVLEAPRRGLSDLVSWN